jgi:tetratricopeptide (TPR) repeat protein
LGARPTLLVLDSVELWPSTLSDLLQALLGQVPSLRLLLTAPHALQLQGECLVELGPLPLPGPDETLASKLLQVEAVQLFLARLRRTTGEWMPTGSALLAVRDACRSCEGNPLAIEIVAGASELDQSAAGWITPPPSWTRSGSESSVTISALDFGYSQLSAEARSAYASVSVLIGSFDARLGAGLADVASPTAGTELLRELANRSLLSEVPEQADRYRMREPVRRHAASKLADAGRGDEVRTRLLERVEEMAGEARGGLAGPDQCLWLDRLDADCPHVRSALHVATLTGQRASGLRVVLGLWRYWQFRGLSIEAEQVIRLLLEAPSTGVAEPLRLEANITLGCLALARGQLAEASTLLEQARERCRELSLSALASRAACALGHVAVLQGSLDVARDEVERSLSEARATGNLNAEHACLYQLGHVALQQHELEEAEGLFLQSEAIAEQLQDLASLGRILSALSTVRQQQGRVEEASALLSRCLDSHRKQGDLPLLAATLTNQSQLLAETGRSQEAVGLLEEALDVVRVTGQHYIAAVALDQLARIEWTLGEQDKAAARLKAACAINAEFGHTQAELANLLHLSELELEAGRQEASCRALRRSLDLASILDSDSTYVEVLRAVGRHAESRGQGDIGARILDCIASAEANAAGGIEQEFETRPGEPSRNSTERRASSAQSSLQDALALAREVLSA